MKNPLLVYDESGYGESVFRGGSWNCRAWYSRVSRRGRYDASGRDYDLSFRLFRTTAKK